MPSTWTRPGGVSRTSAMDRKVIRFGFALGLALAAFACVAAGCTSTGRPVHHAPSDKPTRVREVTAAMFGSAWPLTVSRGLITCMPVGPELFFTTLSGKRYALNGIAADAGMPALTPVWKRAADTPRMDDTPLVEAAEKLCS